MSVGKIRRKHPSDAKAKREIGRRANAAADLSDEIRRGSVPKAFRRWPSLARREADRRTLHFRESPKQTIQEIESISGSRLEKIETGSARPPVHRHRPQHPRKRHHAH